MRKFSRRPGQSASQGFLEFRIGCGERGIMMANLVPLQPPLSSRLSTGIIKNPVVPNPADDMKRTFSEPFAGFSFTKFDGTTITV